MFHCNLSLTIALSLACCACAHAQSLESLEETAAQAAVDAVAPSVVQLRVIGGTDRVEDVDLSSGVTSGVIVSDEGHILTSAYATAGAPESLIAITSTGEQVPTRILATDHNRQLVLLAPLRPLSLPVPEFANMNDAQVGQWAIAIGRAFRADRPNVSLGIVSARYRIGRRALQTDAAVSPANYGGPLVDIRGRVLGVLTPLSTSEGALAGVEWYDSGIGFAIPAGDMTWALDRLKAGEDLHPGKLGVALKPGDPDADPAIVDEVAPSSGAEQAGIAKGDNIVALDGQAIATQEALKRFIAPRYVGEVVRVDVERGGKKETREVTLLTSAPKPAESRP